MHRLKEKFNLYLDLIKTQQDQDGFISSDACDSLLFSGLAGCVPGVKVNIDAAFDASTGTWQRRPCKNPCYPEHSPSTISRDMLVGLAWFIYFNKRLDLSEQIIKYALSHWCMMGEAATLQDKFGRCFLSPGLLATYAEISYRLGGPNRWWLRYLPQLESSTVVGFEAHLSVLHMLLRKLMGVKLSKSHENLLAAHHARQPGNALFAYASGDTASATGSIDVDLWWPETRLPTTLDRSEPWLFQRDYGTDWKPSTANSPETHHGGDYLFVYWLLNQG